MRKILTIFLAFFLCSLSCSAFLIKKKEKPVLFFMPYNPIIKTSVDEKIKNYDVFKKNTRIYYFVYIKEGFKSDYIKYQIIKQDDNAHVGGYTRVRNGIKRVKNKNYYVDYFVLSETGKYALQIFDIQNLHHWITYGHFRVIDE